MYFDQAEFDVRCACQQDTKKGLYSRIMRQYNCASHMDN